MARLALAALMTIAMAQPVRAEDARHCELYKITGYSATDYPGWTADGSTTTVGALDRGEWIVAASWNVPMGAKIEVEELGTFRVADRGMLDARHIDVLVPTRARAYELTGSRQACWWLE